MYFSLNKVLHTPSVFLRDNLSHQEFREIIQHECKKKKGGGGLGRNVSVVKICEASHKKF